MTQLRRQLGFSRHLFVTLLLGGVCAGLLISVLMASGNAKPYMPPLVAQRNVEHWLVVGARQVAGEVRLRHTRLIEPFYLSRDYNPIWLDNFQLTPAAQELIQILQETALDDWRSYGYSISTLVKEASRISNVPRQAMAVEVLLTDAFITYTTQLWNEELIPNTFEPDHQTSLQKVVDSSGIVTEKDVLQSLGEVVSDKSLYQMVKSFTPEHIGYQKLRQQLNRYLSVDQSGMWMPLADDTRLEIGQRQRYIPYIRWLLEQYGDLPETALDWFFHNQDERLESWPLVNQPVPLEQPQYLYDAALQQAMRRFQHRFGLEEHGRIDQPTLEKLNLPPFKIAKRIALNMKRWRHLPVDLGARHIMVNMADFRLKVMHGDDVKLSMKVIVGRQERRTPIMSDTISLMELAPTWTVPPRIAGQYILPKVKRDPSYLERYDYRVVSWRDGKQVAIDPTTINWSKYRASYLPFTFIQQPGEDNALGSVKFLFPNQFSIYLHDTSKPELFERPIRALSSGCVRVEKPLLLADYLLQQDPRWSPAKIRATIAKNRPKRIRLKNPIPIHLIYFTAWVDENNQLQIRPDVYGRDEAINIQQASL